MAASRGSAVRRVGQVLTGFGALVVLCAVLVGAPVALLALAGNPLPDHVPTLAEIGTTLTSRDDGQLFLRALAVLGWFGWATFAFSVLVELVAQVLRRPAPKLPGMRRQQRAAAALVGSVALILAAAPAAASAATVAAAPHPAMASAGPAVASAHSALAAAGPGVATSGPGVAAGGPMGRSFAGPAAAGLPPRAGAPDGPATTPVYRVARGDYLGEVAERYLDDFERYREVAALNQLPDADRIQPGQLIRLPARADDGGVRRHATGHVIPAGSTLRKPSPATESSPPRKPSPHPPAASPTAPRTAPTPDERAVPGETTPGAPTDAGGATSVGGPANTGGPAKDGRAANTGVPGGHADPADPGGQPAGAPPAMAAGASRAGQDDGMNRPLAVSAVLAVASIVGAQIGAVLGLRRRPGRALANGRHRRD
ncbi:LysM peptidoglycan-binding domain-containing protein [Micromonospora sp. NPDC050686]|uniref:LysM peptidoglycan-binding domain-containing protein n=1 Tax=Micromonospora sp. NPDC050686 TaxID=3154631 RepID=UPI0033EC474F